MTPRVVINYCIGAAGPRAIAEAANGVCGLLWHCDLADPHTRAMIPVLRRFGEVITSAPEASLDERAEVIFAFDPAGITTFCDKLLPETAELALRLNLPFHSPPVALSIVDKFAQRRALRSAHLQDMQYRLINDKATLGRALSDLRLPLIVKPVRGQGSRHTFRLGDIKDLDAIEAAISPEEMTAGFIAEEELPGTPGALGDGIGDYISVETVTVHGEHRVAGVVGRLTLAPPFRERGGFYPSNLDPERAKAACQLAVRALTALGVAFGVAHTEVKLTPQGAGILEVNGRLGGPVAWLITRAGGPDLTRAALQAAMGQHQCPDVSKPGKAVGVAFRHYPPAPGHVGIVREVHGVREVRGLPYVETVEMRTRPGVLLDWREGTGSALAEISGWAPTYEKMIRCTDRIEALLRVVLGADRAEGPGQGRGSR